MAETEQSEFLIWGLRNEIYTCYLPEFRELAILQTISVHQFFLINKNRKWWNVSIDIIYVTGKIDSDQVSF